MERLRITCRMSIAAVVMVLAASILACTFSDPNIPVVIETENSTGISQVVEQETSHQSSSTGTADLAKATVQIIAIDDSSGRQDPVWTGSGSFISSEGLILTNAHVVDNRWSDYTLLGIAVTDRTDMPPTLSYLGIIAAVDYDLDLAVIRVISDMEGNPVSIAFPSVVLGDSDAIDIGEHIRILGYPGIGSDTITFTEGAVSGFTSERGIDGRAWIKTDATIAGGSSGGMAVNEVGELIGVPTQASASNEGEVVDCRPVADTNRDGWVDEQDTCVPIGGFINGLRPSNLAGELIAAASRGQEYVEGGGSTDAVQQGSTDEVKFENLEFADGVNPDDTPTQLWYALPANSTQVCAFWDYSGMIDGWSWSAYWFVNGALNEDGSFMDNSWGGSASGNWWVCLGDERGLEEGIYEVVLEVEGEMKITDAVYVGGNRGLATIQIDNQSSDTAICYIQISPTQAQNWGQDELGAQEIIEPAESSYFTLATGEYDLLMSDCDLNTLVEEYGILINNDLIYTYP
ncbi:MAG: trypsin-like peptidase domain-containing protein [Anaerolineales bacterium]|nr:trypsin-like peptidase domain-containing protein [Anaerolineales bacterium]